MNTFKKFEIARYTASDYGIEFKDSLCAVITLPNHPGDPTACYGVLFLTPTRFNLLQHHMLPNYIDHDIILAATCSQLAKLDTPNNVAQYDPDSKISPECKPSSVEVAQDTPELQHAKNAFERTRHAVDIDYNDPDSIAPEYVYCPEEGCAVCPFDILGERCGVLQLRDTIRRMRGAMKE